MSFRDCLTRAALRGAISQGKRDEALKLLDEDPRQIAPNWTLYELHAQEVEFWQADRDRRHTRLRYTRAGRDHGEDPRAR